MAKSKGRLYLGMCLAAALASFLAGFTVGKCTSRFPGAGERPRSTPGPTVLGSCARPGGDVELSEFHPDRKPNGIPLGLPNKVCTKSRSIKCSLSSLDCCKGN